MPENRDLEQCAREAAGTHRVSRDGRGEATLAAASPAVLRYFRQVRDHLAASSPLYGDAERAREWLLDNHYLAERQVRQVANDLPRGFVHGLPRLVEPDLGRCTRVEALARDLVTQAAMILDRELIRRFVVAYQEVATLTTGELWAFPAMLRVSVIDQLARALSRMVSAIAPPPVLARHEREELPLPDDEIVVRAIRCLQTLAVINWQEFFEATSALEHALRDDPGRWYAQMDFETRDAYRDALEEIAYTTQHDENAVAREALARAAQATHDRRRHVGYWLIDRGREQLERDLGFRPRGTDRLRRALQRRPTAWYLGAIAIATLGAAAVPAMYVAHVGAGLAAWVVGLAVTLLPASTLAITLVQWLATQVLPPRVLPKLDFRRGLPDDAQTFVVVPTLAGSTEDVHGLLRRLEVHCLCNPESGLQFALLTDFLDADAAHLPADESVIECLTAGIDTLNRRYGHDTSGPFHAFHRERRWNPAEDRWMGWERKRGKLEEFNRLLRGATDTSYVLHAGDPNRLQSIRYVITLDTDTELPRGAAVRLVGIMAHPLNWASFEPETGRTVDGYTVIQPRVEIAPESGNRSVFTRLFAGDAGFDIYTRAVSDVYQDLFGEGIYVGKGIYDVDAFQASLDDRAPHNALASHDLFEGVHGRAALATDVVLYEDYPPHYLAYGRRLHRWVRGDWQLLPWLARRVPTRGGVRVANRLKLIDRWKIFDNLRRSLLAPSLLLLFAAGWLWLPGNAAIWTVAALLVPAGHVFTALVGGLARGTRRAPIRPWLRGLARTIREGVGRWLLAIVFLVHEAVVVVDAIVRVLVRMAITRKRMLQWTSAARTARSLSARGPRALVWTEMLPGVLVAAGLGATVATAAPGALPAAAPLLVLWLLAPELARRISRLDADQPEVVSEEDRRLLRRLARRTWLFYETFAGPEEQWLAPDHFQEDPKGAVAHRTSPTNIAMHLLSTQAAFDLGYVGTSELAARLGNSLHSLRRLERYRGHPFNWYETQRLAPLLPRYVSSVDSGNLAGALLVLRKSCAEAATMPILRPVLWDGLRDTLELAFEDIERIDASAVQIDLTDFRSALEDLLRRFIDERERPARWWPTIADHFAGTRETLHRRLTTALEQNARGVDLTILRDLRTWVDRLEFQLTSMRREVEQLLPWLALGEIAPELSLPGPEARLDEIPGACGHALGTLERLDGGSRHDPLRAALVAAQQTSRRLIESLQVLAERAGEEFEGMDFSLFYDEERQLLHIGYDATADRMDPHFYDLLASEARLASYIAIIKGDVPQKHWYALGRPITRRRRRVALLSWSATMFEYLMPHLIMRSNERTLLHQSALSAIERQIEYGRSRSAPWGISESGYYAFDADANYQYRAFGVPGLGFKRGLSEDLVVAPYASMLAVALRPGAVLDNLRALRELGMVGPYGLYEAIDFTEERLPAGRHGSIVRSYMAHHQGMCLVAIDNLLGGNPMVRRFHANSLVQSGEMLLNEQIPVGIAPEMPQTETAGPVDLSAIPPTPLPVWSPAAVGGPPDVHLLSNDRLTTVFTSDGGGGLALDDLAVTRWSPGMGNEAGYWIYVQDVDSGALWSAGRAPTSSWPVGARIDFHAHKVELIRRDHGISLHMEVTVSPADDVEVRRLSLTNETQHTRRIALTSAVEPVLESERESARHPAFSRLFLESEVLPDSRCILFRRRPRSPADPPVQMIHRAVFDKTHVGELDTETDRARFLGRLRPWGSPRALTPGRRGLDGVSGAVVDPVISVQVVANIPPRATVSIAFVTAVAASRHQVLGLARKYGSMHEIEWVLQDAARQSASRIRDTGLLPSLLPTFDQLLAALLFPQRALRALPAQEQDQILASQPRLWGYGVSGDFPILLLRLFDGYSPVVSQTLAAHRQWHASGVKVEVVLLNERGSGYRDEVGEHIRRLLSESGSGPSLGHRGGVFLVAGDWLAEGERRLLLAAASVVLDTRNGELQAQLKRRSKLPRELPTLPATMPPTRHEAPVHAPEELRFENGIGGFSADGSEYVMRLDDENQTPAPWCNVLANEQFGSVVSESSLGYTWGINSSEHRLTPWYNDPVCDVSGEALYARDEETAEVWTPTSSPAGSGSTYTVRHGAGYTEYQHDSHGLGHRLRVFVPWEESAKVVQLRIENLTIRPRRLTLTYYAEWVLGTDRERTRAFVVPEYSRQEGCLLARCAWNPEFADRVAFLVAKGQLHGFTCDRTEFLGPEGNRALPAALRRWGLSNEVCPGNDPCAAVQIHMDLAAGEVIETHFVLGEAESRTAALELAQRLRDPEVIEHAWRALHARWGELLGTVSVRTPDPALDLMLNRWWLYQSLAARFLGRTGYYQSSGAYGFRDQLQDVMAYLHAAPELARRHILESAAHQFEDGDVLHWWHPPGDKGVRTRCSDDLLWLPYVTAHYVRCSGDRSILTEIVPFRTADALRPEEHVRYGAFERRGEATLLEHCRRAVDRGFTSGAHGLPLIGDGDWNDGMDRVGSEGRGESVWLAWFAYATVMSLGELLSQAERDYWTQRAEQLREAVEREAWDGAWYRRAFHDDGSIVGSASSVECQIDSISQSWAVLSSAAQDDRARAALRAVRDRLVREQDGLVLLLDPPFARTRHDPGYIRGYPPGIRENGGQYTHAAAWLGWAFAQVGDGDQAARILQTLNPVNHAANRADVERYRVEPYVLAADVYGVAPHIGRGGWTWYTGAASWAWRLGIEAVLGLGLRDGDVVIDPCLPREWDGYEATVRYGEGELHIVVENPDHVSRGIVSIRIDGEPRASNVLPRQPGPHEVVVTIRSSDDASSRAAARKKHEPVETRREET